MPVVLEQLTKMELPSWGNTIEGVEPSLLKTDFLPPVIICVDDEKAILDLLDRQLNQKFGDDYDVELAQSPVEALQLVEDLLSEGRNIAVVISDMIMPKMKGDELLAKLQPLLPDTPKILLTGQADLQSVISAINQTQLFRYISKPWEPNDLNLTIQQACESYLKTKKLDASNQYIQLLHQLNQELLLLSGQVNLNAIIDTFLAIVQRNTNAEIVELYIRTPFPLEPVSRRNTYTLLRHQNGQTLHCDDELAQFMHYIQPYSTAPHTLPPHQLLVSLQKNKSTFGYVLLKNKNPEQKYSHIHQELMQILVSQFVTTIEVSALYVNLEEKTLDLMDSIRYARRIQLNIMPKREMLQSLLPESAVFYRSKDLVSGDFYWWTDFEDQIILSVVDCTGHGVPGAFMSVIGCNVLHQLIKDYNIIEPEVVLQYMNIMLRRTMNFNNQEQVEVSSKDGMDLALINFNPFTKVLQFAGARRPLMFIRNGQIEMISGDKYSIGEVTESGNLPKFSLAEVQLQQGDLVYLFTDGITDQFGGEHARKYGIKRLQDFLLSVQDRTIPEQFQLLEDELHNWQQDLDQTDDILIIGFRVAELQK